MIMVALLHRLLTEAAFVLFAGSLLFWALVPQRQDQPRRSVRIAGAGIIAMMIMTVTQPLLRVAGGGGWAEVITGGAGAVTILQLAALVGAAFFLPDLAGPGARGGRRVVLVALPTVVALTVAAQSAVVGGSPAAVELVTAVLHGVALAAWVGGLIGLIVLLVDRGSAVLDEPVLPRFALVRVVCVAVLIITSVAQGVVAGPAAVLGRYGITVLIEIVLLAAALVLAGYGRTYVARITFRAAYLNLAPVEGPTLGSETHDGGSTDTLVRPVADPVGPSVAPPGVQALIVVLRAELVLAALILVVGVVLVGLTPG